MKKMSALMLSMAMTGSAFALSSGNVIKKSANRIIVKTDNSEQFLKGDNVIINGNTNCNTEVKAVSNDRILLDTKNCAIKSTLNKRAKLSLNIEGIESNSNTDNEELTLEGTSETASSNISTKTRLAQGITASIAPRFGSKAEFSIEGGGFKGEASPSLDATMGVLLGYKEVNYKNLGFSGLIGYTSFSGNDVEGKINVIETRGNLTYGVSEKAYLLGGLNISTMKFTDGDDSILDPGLGLQLGIGAQFKKNLGVELAYIINRNTIDVTEGGVNYTGDVTVSGLEVNLNYTF